MVADSVNGCTIINRTRWREVLRLVTITSAHERSFKSEARKKKVYKEGWGKTRTKLAKAIIFIG